MKRVLIFPVFLIITLISHAQPGPSTISVSFNLPTNFNKSQYPSQIRGTLATYLNGRAQVSSSGTVYYKTLPNPYSREEAVFRINGHPSGIDLFDSVSIGVTIDGVSYFANSKVKSSNSLFVADFSGEYKHPIVCDDDYSIATRYPESRPNKERLEAAIERMRKMKSTFGGSYLVVLSSDQKRISDALVICNGDTLPQSSDGLYRPKNWIKTKSHIEVYHPDYPSLVLDSCILPIETVYLLKEHEAYYLDMGLKHPLKNNNHQKIALRFKVGTKQIVMDSCLQEICTNQHYKIAYHYPDSLKVHNEMIYGGVADLKRIILLERRTLTTIGNSYKKQLDYFKRTLPIDGIFRPVNHATYLNNEITVIYKEGITEKLKQAMEMEYNLNGFRSKYQQFQNPLWVDYELDVFITPNYLVEQLMKDPNIKNVFIGKVEYTHY